MSFIWILNASVTGLVIAAFFSGWLKLKRDIFLMFYIPAILIFFGWFLFANELDVRDIAMKNIFSGLIGAIIAGLFVIKNVYSQPSSPRSKGFALLSDIMWPGFAYGLCDALLLSVVPVLAVKIAFTGSSFSEIWYGKIFIGIIALVASLIVTTAYHIGYSEFRGKKVLWPNIGNGILSLAYIITLNPFAAILPHIAMHIAAMLHGRETTGQVPPHYEASSTDK